MSKISLKAVKAALKSPKTPDSLKRGLLKKYGSSVGKVPMSALATTVKNPKKRARKSKGSPMRKTSSARVLQKYVDKVYKYMQITGEGMTFTDMGHTAKRMAKSVKDARLIQDNFMTFMEMLRAEGIKRGWSGYRRNPTKAHRMIAHKKLATTETADIYVTEMSPTLWIVDIPTRGYSGGFKSEAKVKSFLKAARGMKVAWSRKRG